MSDRCRPTREQIADALHADDCPEDPGELGCHVCGQDYRRQAGIVLALLETMPTAAAVWDEGYSAAAMRVPEGVWHDCAAPYPGNPHRRDDDE